MFISFEGLDGSGKTTQIERLERRLIRAGKRVVRVREPGGTALGEAIRALLLHAEVDIAPMAELLLFSAARAQLVAERIVPALSQGDVVLCDRFYDSSTAYQGGGREVCPVAWMESLHAQATAGRAPDRTYYLHLTPQQAAARRNPAAADRMERQSELFFERVSTAYLDLARRHPERVCLLDATLPPDALESRIWDDVITRFFTT